MSEIDMLRGTFTATLNELEESVQAYFAEPKAMLALTAFEGISSFVVGAARENVALVERDVNDALGAFAVLNITVAEHFARCIAKLRDRTRKETTFLKEHHNQEVLLWTPSRAERVADGYGGSFNGMNVW